MTREAAHSGFERFVKQAVTYTAEQFSVSRALRQGVRGPGSRVVDRLLKNSDTLWDRVVQPELDAYRDRILRQFEVVLDYAESSDGIDAYRDRLLAVDSYANALRADVSDGRRATIHDRLVDRQRRLGDAVEPLVAAPADDFWAATESVFDRAEATELVEDHFAFTGPLVDDRNAYRLSTQFDPADILGGASRLLAGRLPTVEVEYTDEALRSMRRAEQQVIDETKTEIARRY